jgi:hypothetical protein
LHFIFPSFLVGGFLLLILSSSCVASGRELICNYSTYSGTLWPTSQQCKLSSVDLSERHKTEEHSFTGTPEQKAAVTVIHFDNPLQFNFLPNQMLNDFPKLNGMDVSNCNTLKTVKSDLFTEDFGAIQYLYFGENRIATIEANAFQHLPKLKWISLTDNQLRSLPHQIFKNNPELIYIGLGGNKINSITPDFFKNLNKLQFVGLRGNQCIKKDFGCTTGSGCSVSQWELDSDLTACYNNYRNHDRCASKSGNCSDNFSLENIMKNIDLIASSATKGKL